MKLLYNKKKLRIKAYFEKYSKDKRKVYEIESLIR